MKSVTLILIDVLYNAQLLYFQCGKKCSTTRTKFGRTRSSKSGRTGEFFGEKKSEGYAYFTLREIVFTRLTVG